MTKTVAERITHDADAIDAALARIDVELDIARSWSRSIRNEVRPDTPLPAPALTEQAIVDALKADPTMAGRVLGEYAAVMKPDDAATVSWNAKAAAEAPRAPVFYRNGLQSLAVALAAASYRG